MTVMRCAYCADMSNEFWWKTCHFTRVETGLRGEENIVFAFEMCGFSVFRRRCMRRLQNLPHRGKNLLSLLYV